MDSMARDRSHAGQPDHGPLLPSDYQHLCRWEPSMSQNQPPPLPAHVRNMLPAHHLLRTRHGFASIQTHSNSEPPGLDKVVSTVTSTLRSRRPTTTDAHLPFRDPHPAFTESSQLGGLLLSFTRLPLVTPSARILK